MRSRIIFLVGLVLALAFSTAAQTRSLTNTSLEVYKQERLKNESEYRENYARLGLPSPEEIARRNVESAKAMAELSARLNAEQIARAQFDAERRAASRRAVSYYRTIVIDNFIDYSSYRYFRPRHHFWLQGQPVFNQAGYFAGGQFWPTGSVTPSHPMFAPHGNK